MNPFFLQICSIRSAGRRLSRVVWPPGVAAASMLLCLLQSSLAASAGMNHYFLVTPVMEKETYLVSFPGEVRHVWPSKLLPSGPGRVDANGSLLRVERDHLPKPFSAPGGAGGRITKMARDGTEQWSHSLASMKYLVHHDALPLPNGHVLALVWERHEAAEAATLGRDMQKMGKPGVWSECVWEIQPLKEGGGRVVWQWKAWDHLRGSPAAAAAPHTAGTGSGGSIDINGGWAVPAWAGVTRLEYSAARDQILLLARGYGAVWIIDHSTTTLEAASTAGGKSGKGGGILYEWSGGVPQQPEDSRNFIVDAEWLEDENADPSIHVLRWTRKDGGTPAYAMEDWRLPVDAQGGYLPASGGNAAPVLLSSQPLAFASSDWSTKPTALSGGMVTLGTAGVIRQAKGEGGGWDEFKNQNGQTTLRISRPAPDQETCCGGEPAAPVKAAAALNTPSKPVRLTSAPVMRSAPVQTQPWMAKLPAMPATQKPVPATKSAPQPSRP